MPKFRPTQRGLTLIECLVCLGILSLGLVAVAGALTAALISNEKASQIQLATAVAQDLIEEMRSRGFGAVTYDGFPATASVPGLHSGTRTVLIEDGYTGSPRLKHVTINVTWRAPNRSDAHIKMDTVIGNRGGHVKG
jgi:prepilin-type N-terminal cleavage/methylation domain-containing protein